MDKKTLTIIIVTYNSQDHIESCLKSIENQEISSDIIFIDNNSADKTLEKLEKIKNKKSNITLIKNKLNLGFAKAVNQGITYSKKTQGNQLFLLLNPDATLEKNCLKKMIEKINSKSEIGLCSPIIKNPKNNKIIFRQGLINWWKMKTLHSKNSTRPTDYLTGCCLLIKKSVLDKVKGFDENFFLYYEDADFCLRAREKGFLLSLAEKATCFHQESQSSNSKIKNYHLVKSGLIFFHKHFHLLIRLFYFWPIFWLRWFYHFLFTQKKSVIQGLEDFYLKK